MSESKASDSEIVAGDIVQLKSGSDSMTVESVEDHRRDMGVDIGKRACCIWKGQNHELITKNIALAALKKI